MRYREPGRWIIACINWSHPDAPHAALVRVGPDGYFDAEFYLPTFADAWAKADEIRAMSAKARSARLEVGTLCAECGGRLPGVQSLCDRCRRHPAHHHLHLAPPPLPSTTPTRKATP